MGAAATDAGIEVFQAPAGSLIEEGYINKPPHEYRTPPTAASPISS